MKTLRGLLKDQSVGAPGVGYWQPRVAAGQLISEGAVLGVLTELAVPHLVESPQTGTVLEVSTQPAVGYGDLLVTLGAAAAGTTASTAVAGRVTAAGQSAMKAPSSGRFFCRPGPDRPPFVKPGDEISTGQVVCLLEVMKTFNRIEYGGPGLPARARVITVVPADGDDIESGDPILVIDPIA